MKLGIKITVPIICILLSYALLYSVGVLQASLSRTMTERKSEPPQTKYQNSLEETASPEESKSDMYWLDSGAIMFMTGNTLWTFQGDMPSNTKWYALYIKSNPLDTDNGLHPQNILRLITRNSYENATATAYFTIEKINLSESTNRNASNGIFHMIHYIDDDNVYYAGLRVDGTAVIKKKSHGTYYTLAEAPVFVYSQYDPKKVPSLLPLNTPLGIKASTKTLDNGSVQITLSIDIGKNNSWTEILKATDTGHVGGTPFVGANHDGIRSDFMDLEIDDYMINPN